MGWWIFKSSKEKYMDQLIRRLDRIEATLTDDLEDDVLSHIESRVAKIEKALTEPEETTKAQAPATPASLTDTAAIVRGIWDSVPPMLKPWVNKQAQERLGKSVDELLEDSKAINQLAGIGATVAKGLADKVKPSSENLGLLEEEKPMPTGH